MLADLRSAVVSLTGLLAGIGTCGDGALADAGTQTVAREILKATGVQGGLIVHVGCGDAPAGELTAALTGAGCLVQGLDTDPARVEQARREIQSRGIYGAVSVDDFDGQHLPYAENLVNLLVLSSAGGELGENEIRRVLAPGGVAVKIDGNPRDAQLDILFRKPWPAEIDEWTHWMHDAGQSGVARDRRVGPPRRLQWLAEPLWGRGHEVISSVGAAVTARGRLFYAVDESQTAVYSLPSRWMLVARDAFNGVLLWKRPLEHWSAPVTLGGFTNGFQPRRLATDGQRVYLPLGEQAVLTALDAASGATVMSVKEASGVAEVLCDDGLLVVVMRGGKPSRPAGQARGGGLLAAAAQRGNVLWQGQIVPQATALASGLVVSCAAGQVVAQDARTGNQKWSVALDTPEAKAGRRAAAATLRVLDDRVVVESSGQLLALSASDGQTLWEQRNAPVSRGELFASEGLLWRPQGEQVIGHDLATGEIRQTIDASSVFSPGHHPRCYPCKATEHYVITNNRGAEFVSLTAGEHVQNDWLRGSCGLGILPANGLLYVPPNPCFCYPGVKLLGFNALAPAAEGGPPKEVAASESRLVRGPAYGDPELDGLASTASDSADWPMYRRDAARHGATACDVPPEVEQVWDVSLPAPLTPPVVAEGRLFVAAKDQHTLYAFSADDGRPLWQFTAGGRIDSPPSVAGKLVLFGSADGRVYCLRASDGQLVWRFQAAPSPQRIIACGQLESPWRVHGSVLVQDGQVSFTAGRSSYLDGGIRVFALEPATGRLLHQTCIDSWAATRRDAEGKPFVPAYHIEGALSDVLVSQGGFLYLGQVKLDQQLRPQEVPYVLLDPQHPARAMDLSEKPYVAGNEQPGNDYEEHQRQWVERTQQGLVADLRKTYGSFNYGYREMGLHVLATSGLLDDSWFNRTSWMYATRWPGFYLAHRAAKSGQLLVVGPQRTYAVQAFPSRNLQSPLFNPGDQGYLLLADANDSEPVLDDKTVEVTKGWGFTRSKPPQWFDWVPIRIRAMVLAGRTLFVAGPPDEVDPADPLAAWEGRRGGILRSYRSVDGKRLAETELDAPPVFDGLIAANERLYVVTTRGQVLCLGRP